MTRSPRTSRIPAHREPGPPQLFPPPKKRPSFLLPLVLVAALLPVGGGLVVVAKQKSTDSIVPTASVVTRTLSVAATEDAYVTERAPNWNFGSSKEFSAVSKTSATNIGYVKFRLIGLPAGATVVRARLDLRRTLHHLSGRVDVHAVSTSWDEDTLTWKTRPALGAQIATSAVDLSTRNVRLSLPGMISGNGVYAVAVTSPNTSDHVRFRSTESGQFAPKLTITYTAPGVVSPPVTSTKKPSPPSTAKPTATPGPGKPTRGTPSSAPTSTRASTPPVVPPVPGGGSGSGGAVKTLWGASPGGLQGESPRAAFERIDAAFRGLDAVRWWPADGSVPKWSSLPPWFGNRAVAMSMKLPPRDVAAGKYDSALAEFFRTAPTNRMILATFYHEPEDNINAGEFTVQDYKAAWTRFSKIARANAPANLKTTMILMAGTYRGDGNYGHDWHYYIVPGTFDVLGGDDYQFMVPKVAKAADVIGPHMAAAAELGLPFAILEMGTRQNSPTRSEFLRDAIKLTDGKALMVLAFESWRGSHGPWNIIGTPAQAVWQGICSRS